MKRALLLILVFGLSGVQAAEALQWKSMAVLSVVQRQVSADEFKVKSRGIHRVLVTSVAVWERVLPLRIRIDYGDLLHNGAPMSSCGVGWTLVSNRESITCTTRYTQQPCEDGVWDAETLGRLEGHPQGGLKFALANPIFIDCSC